MYKKASGAGSWYVWDTARMKLNPSGSVVYPLTPNDVTTEAGVGAGGLIDILSNGFKIRTTWGDINASGATIVYMAWAENPFGGNAGTFGDGVSPATAR